ncbi:MAG TPA: amidohydrolase family protein [Stellaceae bacterium]|nr:amidohydrolase family protein [Stellaceae bacterium]
MSEPEAGKIALEEHFYLPSFEAHGADGSALDGAGKAHNYEPEYFATVQKRLGDVELWLEDMDRCGIERMVLSLTQPGIQGIPDRAVAIDTAKRMNDDLAAILAAYPDRFLGFAAVALQDVRAAGDELERAVSQLGFKGALINGYSNIGDMNTAQYLDERPVWDFWARVEALGVPVYLHPRSPLLSQRRAYEGYPVLADSPWGFGAETALHTLRLILSGLFDHFPRLGVILGHLGEGLPFLLPRVEHRLRHMSAEVRGRQLKPVMSYLRENFYLTTAGHFRTQALIDTLLEVGSDRLLFSVDYPYETAQEQSDWFDSLPISEGDRSKISRLNAIELLGLQDGRTD